MNGFRVVLTAGVAAAVAYAAYPIGRNAVWNGAIGPLVVFALAPFVFGVLARGGRTALRTGPGRFRLAAGGARFVSFDGEKAGIASRFEEVPLDLALSLEQGGQAGPDKGRWHQCIL